MKKKLGNVKILQLHLVFEMVCLIKMKILNLNLLFIQFKYVLVQNIEFINSSEKNNSIKQLFIY